MQPGKPNVGLKLPAEEVAGEIVRRDCPENWQARGRRVRRTWLRSAP
jgi:hypothetical protein